ncbi:NADH-ubiquinone oxidoreductase-F iron-sulfur binding region domain-containing protein [Propionivibrio sp.]|uniref:NADH-ubiquinone oxidoreductase-F iron-sulfur binding region domain-containing protein n=1 Tax=Propionivibrio sp. TaxID=2212460 RepID=UPI00272E22AF|nr:NADH-ubiquinone oxidoreductase-F iron-sulfur binding region domain-containing protein [Propionivibrio sp.]
MRIHDLDGLHDIRRTGLMKLLPGKPRIGVGMGTCGMGNGAREVFQALERELERQGVDAQLTPVGCFGFCAAEPLVNVHIPGLPLAVLGEVKPDDAAAIVQAIALRQPPLEKAICKIEEWDHLTGHVMYGRGLPELPHWNEIPFFKGQKKIVLRNCGLINPEDIEEYIAVGGYHAFYQATQKPNVTEIIEEVKKSKLRGRGGAGYPTGVKWDLLSKTVADQKYIICNADEGDPGAYMNRNEIESDPHMLIEGMLIGAFATGASEGIVYLRAEYPLAVQRLKRAVAEAREFGLIGDNVLGTSFCFDIKLVEGAGAFVCGEETAMIESLEGRAGRPRPRPPFPAQKGLWGKPTNINNVETWCNVPVIVARGGAWFSEIGTAQSTGTKVFSLVGKIRNTGLVELPLGTPLKNVIYDIGQGSPGGKRVKALQSGGPSGGCIPADNFDVTIDYESLAQIGAIMGSGGMVVMDEDNCMVDVARYFVEFTHSESCGKCIPCRAGLDQALRILKKITGGQAEESDIQDLEELGQMIKEMSLCGLGQTAPNPVLTTLRYFRHEYEEHLRARRCRAGVCEDLFLSPCENSCPLHMRIPQFLELTKEGRIADAAEMIWLDNPLPGSTGRICQHPCESQCRRKTVDAPLNMREVHRFISDQVFGGPLLDEVRTRLAGRRMAATGKKIAIVGAGPSGLAAGFYLALLGHDVTIHEAREEAGGMLRYSLPQYRLPKDMLSKELEIIAGLGVTFRFGQKLGAGVSLDVLEAENDAVFLATGTWKAARAGITGEESPSVWHAIHFLEQVARGEPTQIGQKVVVIGGGNAAVDSARTALRLGCEVTIAYRRERQEMPAIAEEVTDAEAEGVRLQFLVAPQRVVTDKRGRVTGIELMRTKLGDYTLDGRRRPMSTSEKIVVPCDNIILAIGERPDAEPLRRFGIHVRENDTAAADWVTYETNRPRVFAGGDLVTGASNVSSTMATGKAAARAIDHILTGQDRLPALLGTFDVAQAVPPEPEGGARNVSEEMPAAQRRANFAEVMRGLTQAQAAAESGRCLRCDVRETCSAKE